MFLSQSTDYSQVPQDLVSEGRASEIAAQMRPSEGGSKSRSSSSQQNFLKTVREGLGI